jgi:2-keto-4-pentenoate hydratase/2-oxohepta-3-ene-1,7-dioic acid hydratase in catechol pathway
LDYKFNAMPTLRYQNQEFTPGKILCVGRNYVDHIHELGNEIPDNMVVFNKPASAISDTLSSFQDEPLHYESELSFLVEGGTFSAVAFGIDITKRELQSKLKSKSLPWERAKAFDGSAVFSEFVPIPGDITELNLRLTVNTELRQHGGVELMMYKPTTILEELRSYTTLDDFDVVMTGTPAGVGMIGAGDVFRGEVWHQDQLLTQSTWTAI